MASSAFQRSPSKVWWAGGLETVPSSEWQTRTGTGSPSSHKSQDSGFSDSETSPPLGANSNPRQHNEAANIETPKKYFTTDKTPANILKDIISSENITPKKNLTESIEEKYSPKKSILKQLTDECLKRINNQRLYERHNPYCRSLPSTPKNRPRNFNHTSKSSSQNSSPAHSPILFHKLTLYSPQINKQEQPKEDYHTPKVNRNLLNYFPKDLNDNIRKDTSHNDLQLNSISLPLSVAKPSMKSKLNATVPLYYHYNLDKIDSDFDDNVHSASNSNSDISVHDNTFNETVSSDNRLSPSDRELMSDCEKELESFFPDHLESPTHTSTPKACGKKGIITTIRKKIARQKKSSHFLNSFDSLKECNPNLMPQMQPVKCWLNEVEQLYEPECMTTLQCKSIANDLSRQVLQMAENVTAPITEMMRHAKIIRKEFNQLKTQLHRNNIEHLAPLSQSLVGNVTEFVLKNMVNSQASSLAHAKHTKDEIHKLLEISSKMRQATQAHSPNLEQIHSLTMNFEELFYATELNILTMQIQLLVNAIEEPGSHLTLRGVLSGLTSLSLQCERLNRLVVEAGGPRALLILCVECKASTIRTMALRTLATICCSTTAIRQLEQAEGVDVLADILSDSKRPEPELSEATAVLAQITAPWIEDNHSLQGLSQNINTLITAITNFLEKTKCCQNLLLSAAALANITYMSTTAVSALIHNKTVAKLLSAVQSRGPKVSVFLKEQTATLIANLSDIPESRNHLAQNNVAVALLCFLQIFPIISQDGAQSNAAQRLQQKSAIALSRLCSDRDVSQQLVELGGVTRLVQLCKEGKERNNSDAVLVACLATLRKIVANCGNDVMDQQDIIELVEPRLLDSFLAYCTQNESYV